MTNRTEKLTRLNDIEATDVARVRDCLAAYKAVNKTADRGAALAAADMLSIRVGHLLETVERLRAIADYYEQRDARFDQATASIRNGGAR